MMVGIDLEKEREKMKRNLTASGRLEEAMERARREEEQWKLWEEQRQQKMLRLNENDRQFTDTIGAFLKDEAYICFDFQGKISCSSLYSIYYSWCKEKRLLPKTLRELGLYLKKNGTKLQIAPTIAVFGEEGKRARGYRGIRSTEETRTTDK